MSLYARVSPALVLDWQTVQCASQCCIANSCAEPASCKNTGMVFFCVAEGDRSSRCGLACGPRAIQSRTTGALMQSQFILVRGVLLVSRGLKLFLLYNGYGDVHGGHTDAHKVPAKALCNHRKVFSILESRRWSIPADALLPSHEQIRLGKQIRYPAWGMPLHQTTYPRPSALQC